MLWMFAYTARNREWRVLMGTVFSFFVAGTILLFGGLVGWADDGDGTLTVSPSSVSPGGTTSYTFTYTVNESGGLRDGGIEIDINSAFTTPTTTSGNPGYVSASITSGTGQIGGVVTPVDTVGEWTDDSLLILLSSSATDLEGSDALNAAVTSIGLGDGDVSFDMSTNRGSNEDWSGYTHVSLWGKETTLLTGNTVSFYIQDSVNGRFVYSLGEFNTTYAHYVVDFSADAASLTDVEEIGIQLPLNVVNTYDIDNISVGPIAAGDSQYDNVSVSGNTVSVDFVQLSDGATVDLVYATSTATTTTGTYTMTGRQRVDASDVNTADGTGAFTAFAAQPTVGVGSTGPATYLTVRSSTGSSSVTTTAGTATELEIRAYDASGVLVINYEGSKNLTFSGLSTAGDGTNPTVEGTNVGVSTAVVFADGVSTTSAATLIPYLAETASLDVSDGSIDSTGDALRDLDLVVGTSSASAADSLIGVSPSPATTTDTVTVTVTARDSYQNVLTAGGATVVISVTGSNTTTPAVTDNSNGTYTATYTATNAGTDQITATLGGVSVGEDTDGTSDGTFNLTVKSSGGGLAPAPVVTSLATDSGASSTDAITNDNTPLFSGTATSTADELELYIDGTLSGTTTVSGGNWTYQITGALSDGDYDATAVSIDTDTSQRSATSSAFAITIDTTPPVVSPTVPTATTTYATTTQTLTGSCGSGAASGTVSITTDAANGFTPYPATSTLDGSGNWSIPVTWSNGTYDVLLVCTDTAGNTGATTTVSNVTINSALLPAPVVTSVTNDTGASSTDAITNDNTLIVAGTATTTVTQVEMFVDGSSVGTTTAAAGSWSFDYTGTTLADGDYDITVVGETALSELTATSASYTVTIDTTAPSAPPVTSPSGSTAIATSTTVTGTCESGNTVTIISSLMSPTSATTTCSGGTFSYAGTFATSTASTTVEVSQTDPAGNNSATTTVTNVYVTSDDGDNVSLATENDAHNGGDGNGDGTPDGAQSYVASFVNSVTSRRATIAVDNPSCTITNITTMNESSAASQDSGYDYPFGMFDFTVDCGTPGIAAQVDLYFDQQETTSSWVMRKYSSSTNTYVSFDDLSPVTSHNMTVSDYTFATGPEAGETVTRVTYTIVDGESLDDDGLANGIIVDPMGPGSTVSSGSSGGGGGGSSATIKSVSDTVSGQDAIITGRVGGRDNWELYVVVVGEEVDSSPRCTDTGSGYQWFDVPGTYDEDEIFEVETGSYAEGTYYYRVCGRYNNGSSSLRDSDVETFEITAQTETEETEEIVNQTIDTIPTVAESVCEPYLTQSISRKRTNDPVEVNKLVAFLNEYEGEQLVLDGSYDDDDYQAVKRFQLKYKRSVLDIWGIDEPTGYVFLTTRAKINSFKCQNNLACPVFTQYNSLNQNNRTSEVQRTKTLLYEMGFFTGSINQTFDGALHAAMVRFQETFSATMLKPWGLMRGTGYKYKTTNKYMNELVGCSTDDLTLENGVTVSY